MEKTLYRVCPGANLSAFPSGTKVGDAVPLTEAEAEALYERDMGRIISLADEAKAVAADAKSSSKDK